MRSSIILSAIALFAGSVAAQADSADALSHGSYIASRMRRRANVDLNSGEYMKRNIAIRDATPSSSSSAPVPTNTGFVNLNPTMQDTMTSCTSGLSGQTADDSGMVPCFSINFFDNSTGSFQANVLLYRVSNATGAWANTKSDASVYINFPGAPNSDVFNTTAPVASVSRRSELADTPLRRVISARAGTYDVTTMATYVGTVDQSYMSMLSNSTAMREALTPNITLVAVGADNKNISDTPAATTSTSFVDGWFSQMYLDQQTAIKNAVPAPFVLPGTTLGISKGLYPIGLEVTSAWVIVFAAVVGYGTLGRLQWRRDYRAGKPTASGR